ncbi:MAG: hypothetical protein ACKVJG_21970 [Candidatus Latescibacterota bacterium]|jgi:hypothetical protein|tara:strand:+ start:102 stop:305 length:204 start_codon:yes stop_codon:yes gene_type:complete
MHVTFMAWDFNTPGATFLFLVLIGLINVLFYHVFCAHSGSQEHDELSPAGDEYEMVRARLVSFTAPL